LRHRIRRTFRKTCCFSKKLFNHFKAFNLAFFYINFGFVSISILWKIPPKIDLPIYTLLFYISLHFRFPFFLYVLGKSALNEVFRYKIKKYVTKSPIKSFPYDGHCYNTPDILRDLYLTMPNIRILDKYVDYMYLIYGNNATGGVVIVNTQKFYQAGMDNEDFYGWGNGDTERYHRLQNLGCKIYRSPGHLYHLSHPRDLNGKFHSDVQYNKTLSILKKVQDNIPFKNK
jgi:hypothetical protein